MAVTRITERFAFTGGKVDREAGTIAECLICGPTSENARDYPWGGSLRGAHAKYEGAPSNCDHGKDDSIDRRLGWFTGVAPGADGQPRGTFNLLKSHPMYERVMEAAERNPKLFGFSHVIEAKTSRRDGREIVESIERVVSIDLVAVPATTKGLFEHKEPAVKTTLRAVVEAFRDKLPAERQAACRKLLLLAEDDAATGALMGAPVDEPPAGAEADDAIDGAFKTLMHAQLDALLDESATLAQFLSNIRELFKTRAKVMGKSEPKADDGATPAEAKVLDAGAVIAECKLWQFAPSYEQGEHLRRIPHQDTRKLVVESMRAALKQAAGETPKSAPRTVKEDVAGEVPTLDEMKKRIRG
jgi:hypothetical protein